MKQTHEPGAPERADRIMARVRERVGLPADSRVLTGDVHPAFLRPRLPVQRAYALHELLDYDDADFVDTAYWIVLRRAPDPEGRASHLDALRRGAISKVEVLGALRWSQEGMDRGVHIDGLLLPLKLRQWKRKRFIGPLIAWCQGVLNLGSLGARQERETARVAWDQQAANERVTAIVADNERRHAELRDALRRADEDADALRGALDVLIAAMRERDEREARESRELAAGLDAERAMLDPLYAALEDRFRGSAQLIRDRLTAYLPLMTASGAGTPEAPIVDLGSGRGEWLRLLSDLGMHARGIDTNADFVAAGVAAGFDVVEQDALSALAAMPDASVGAVTAFHLVEHVPFDVLVRMLDEIRRVLRPGGIVVLETPNPENLQVSTHWFYMDPTHRNPIPPEALNWLVGVRGFEQVRIERQTLGRDIGAPDLLPEGAPHAHAINSMLQHYRAAADYAVIGVRP